MHFQNILLVAGTLLSYHVIALPLSDPTIGNQPSDSNLETRSAGIQTRDDGLSVSKGPTHSLRSAPDKLKSRADSIPTKQQVKDGIITAYTWMFNFEHDWNNSPQRRPDIINKIWSGIRQNGHGVLKEYIENLVLEILDESNP